MTVEKDSERGELVGLMDFIVEYTRRLLGSGVHTSRVIRNAVRIATSQNADLNILVTLRCLIITLRHEGTCEVVTRVVSVTPLPISFQLNSELSALSWAAVDEHLSFEELRRRYLEIINRPRRPQWLVLILLSLANGAFCRLFSGDWIAVTIVILATAVGYSLKLLMTNHRLNVFFTVAMSAFAASMTASLSLMAGCTWQTAVATSPLFLVPGVPLITCIIDAVEGHVLTAVSRFVNAMLIIMCIAAGLGVTLLLITHDLPVDTVYSAIDIDVFGIFTDALFAAIAAIGFGAVSNPKTCSFKYIALLAALGHCSRFALMEWADVNIAFASLCGSLVIGFGSVICARPVRVPMTCLSIPALLPMIPGIYAYKTVFSLIKFMQELHSPGEGIEYMQAFFLNGSVTICVVFFLALGAVVPLFIFKKRAVSMTRHI